MIYTVTFNPSLDYIVSVPEFKPGRTNRTQEEILTAGGKGINVSLVLMALGVPNTALGFTAGFVGEEIRRQLRDREICCDFLTLPEGCSRINVKLKNLEGTEINGRGPSIDEASLSILKGKISRLSGNDILVLSGSIPSGMSKTLYAELMKLLPERVKVVVDAAGETLLHTLPQHPFLIKPNRDELAELLTGKHRELSGLEKYDIIRDSRVGVVNPSGLTETFCISAVEMESCGVPVCTAGKYGLLDTVKNEKNGLYSNDDKELAANIVKLLLDDKLNETYSANAIASSKKFTPEAVMPEWMQVFDEILNNKEAEYVKPSRNQYRPKSFNVKLRLHDLRFNKGMKNVPSFIGTELCRQGLTDVWLRDIVKHYFMKNGIQD